MKILVSIISCAHHRGNRLRVCLDTWGKDIDDLIIFSGESGEENKPDDGGVCKIIKASNSDDYNSNVAKIMFALKHLQTNEGVYDWYFFLDDDSYLNYKNLVLELKGHSPEDCFIMGRELNEEHKTWKQEPELRYCSGGAGIVMNRLTLEKLKFPDDPSANGMHFGDVAVGRVARDSGVTIKHNGLFHGNASKILGHDDKTIRKQITYHKLATSESMNELHNIIIQE